MIGTFFRAKDRIFHRQQLNPVSRTRYASDCSVVLLHPKRRDAGASVRELSDGGHGMTLSGLLPR